MKLLVPTIYWFSIRNLGTDPKKVYKLNNVVLICSFVWEVYCSDKSSNEKTP